MKRNWNVALIFFLVLANCGKKSALAPGMTGLTFQGTAPGAFGAKYGALQAVSATSVAVVNRDGSTAGTLTLSDARIALKEIKFKPLNDVAPDVKYQGPYIVNLLTNVVSPELPAVKVTAGTYERIELKLAKLQDGAVAADDPMARKSIYLAGTYTGMTAGGSVTNMPFVLSFELDEEFFLSGANNLVISETAPNPIILAFRLNRWLRLNDSTVNDKNVDFSSVVVSSGKITLSDQSNGVNQNIWEVIRRGIKLSADFGRDENDDGILESNEDEDTNDAFDS